MKGGVMRAIFNLTSLGTLSQVEKDAGAISPVVRLWDKYLQKCSSHNRLLKLRNECDGSGEVSLLSARFRTGNYAGNGELRPQVSDRTDMGHLNNTEMLTRVDLLQAVVEITAAPTKPQRL